MVVGLKICGIAVTTVVYDEDMMDIDTLIIRKHRLSSFNVVPKSYIVETILSCLYATFYDDISTPNNINK